MIEYLLGEMKEPRLDVLGGCAVVETDWGAERGGIDVCVDV